MPSMPQPAQPDHNTSPTEEVILGVDTHKDIHVAAVITTLGAVTASHSFPTTRPATTSCWPGHTASGRCGGPGGMHRLLRRGPHPAPAGRRHHRHRGQPVRQGHPPPWWQDRHHRRPGRRPGGAVGPGDRHRQDRRRASGDAADVQARQDLSDQVPHPGDQPAQGRPGGRRPDAACGAVSPAHPDPHPPLHPAPHRHAQRRHQRRDLDTAATGLPDHRADQRDRRPQPAARPRRQPAHRQAAGAARVGPDRAAALLITAGTTPSGWAAKPPTPRCAAPVRSRCPPPRPPACA
jgi:hypothetical protein